MTDGMEVATGGWYRNLQDFRYLAFVSEDDRFMASRYVSAELILNQPDPRAQDSRLLI